MRTLDSALITAQQASSRTPYVCLLFISPDEAITYDYSTDISNPRLLMIDHYEEPFNDYAYIMLRNNDRQVPSLVGYHVEIEYGDKYDDGGITYGAGPTARLWVKAQHTISIAGKCYVYLELGGMWQRMAEVLLRLGTAPLYQGNNNDPESPDYVGGMSNLTIYDMCRYLLSQMPKDGSAYWDMYAIGSVDDGIINTFKPVIVLNQNSSFENVYVLMKSLINMTFCRFRSRIDCQLQVIYPRSTDEVDETYYSYQVPYFYEFSHREALVMPNKVIVFANAGVDGLWSDIITAESVDTSWDDDTNDFPTIVIAPEITSQQDAENRADVYLYKYQQAADSGKLIIPHDARVELWDRVKIVDGRGL